MQKIVKLFIWGLSVALVAACGGRETHFMADKAYREAVHADFEVRMAANDSALARVVEIPADALTSAEREALEFLYAYMPLADVTDYPESYYLDQVRASEGW